MHALHQAEVDACQEKFDEYLEKKELCEVYMADKAAGRSTEGLSNPCKDAKVMMKEKPKKGEKIAKEKPQVQPGQPSDTDDDSEVHSVLKFATLDFSLKFLYC